LRSSPRTPSRQRARCAPHSTATCAAADRITVWCVQCCARLRNSDMNTVAETRLRRPGSLEKNPRLSQWLRVHRDGTVSIYSGKVEIGQGILTALAQIAAEELGIAIERIRMVPADTAVSPDEGVTSGSLSIQDCGVALRRACAHARALLLERATARLG